MRATIIRTAVPGYQPAQVYRVPITAKGQRTFSLSAINYRLIEAVRLSGIVLSQDDHYTVSSDKKLHFLLTYFALDASDRLEILYQS